MSDTRQKLEEAKYFLEQMQVSAEDRKKFAFNLSAFLSAARSVTFIMQSEFKSYPGFNDWYKDKQEEMNNDRDFKFFNKLRVATIHKKPVVPYKKIEIDISETIHISESVTIRVTDKEGKVISEQTLEPKESKSSQETEVAIRHSWYFEKSPHDDLFELCNKYIQKIEKLVGECETRFHKGKNTDDFV